MREEIALTGGRWELGPRGVMVWVPTPDEVEPQRACESCGADISHKRADARFCRKSCQHTAWRYLNPERVLARDRARYGERRRENARIGMRNTRARRRNEKDAA